MRTDAERDREELVTLRAVHKLQAADIENRVAKERELRLSLDNAHHEIQRLNNLLSDMNPTHDAEVKDGAVYIRERKEARTPGELSSSEELRAWAYKRIVSAIQERPGDMDRADALLGLGILMAQAGR